MPLPISDRRRSPLLLAVPGSKSQTQRALLLAALASGTSELVGALDCDDSRALRRCLRALGIAVARDARRWRVTGGRQLLRAPRTGSQLWCGAAGSALRFLAPLSLLLDGELWFAGEPRLGQRPLAGLIDALELLGVAATAGEGSWLPLGLRRRPDAAAVGEQQVAVDASQSSQFASGLLMVAPCLAGGLSLELRHGEAGGVVSRPYLELTRRMMAAFGAEVQVAAEGCCWRVSPGAYRPRALEIEGDWSSAAFLLAGGFIVGREVKLSNVDAASSWQGDRVIVELLAELGRPRPHRLDLSQCPDLIAPLAAAAVFAAHEVQLVNVAAARLKESDRISVLAAGLRRAGARVVERADGLQISPGGSLGPATLDARRDHRMAMAFGLLSLRQPALRVEDPACVSKSFPGFWQQLERLRG